MTNKYDVELGTTPGVLVVLVGCLPFVLRNQIFILHKPDTVYHGLHAS